MLNRSDITQQARLLGFDTIGVAPAQLARETSTHLKEFIRQQHHGDMLWMEEKLDRRSDPKTLWPDARSIIVLGHNYAPRYNPMEKLRDKTIGNISCYALNEDYHEVIKKKLKTLARWLVAHYGCEVKVFVDTAPVMEKPLAALAGLGWQGKHTCLVSREFGCWLFIGSIFTTLDLSYNEEQSDAIIPSPLGGGLGWGHDGKDRMPLRPPPSLPPNGGGIKTKEFNGDDATHCGSCMRCLDICPTQAFTSANQLDARKCISYLTIEHKGQIPLEHRKAIGNRIYGCDDCLSVCPWNKFAQTAKEMAYRPRAELEAPTLRQLAQLDDASFRKLFAKSPVKRIGRNRFVRNVLVAVGNSEDANLLDVVEALLQDDSELVREMAEWAKGELVDF